MKQGLSLLLSLGYCSITQGIFLNSATAQVTPDGTTNTTVNADGNNFTINQGSRAGGNLFHSFRDFSVPNGGEAFFNNAANIANIFSRVTGGNISNIDGLIRANGGANLFLINPAGIIFGQGASLDIGGSFYGSTADSILFEDGEFSATDLDNPPLLTINAPIGLNFRDSPQTIEVQADNLENSNSEILAPNITLIGGDVILNDATITASNGRIELGGLSSAGEVGINQDGTLDFAEQIPQANISLNNSSELNASTEGTNLSQPATRGIRLSGETVRLDSSAIVTDVAKNSNNDGGNVLINALDIIFSSSSRINATTSGNEQANAGDVEFNAANVTFTDNSFIFGNAIEKEGGGGNAADVAINASGNVVFTRGNSDSDTGSFILNQIFPGVRGDAGDISIKATNLSFEGRSFLVNNNGNIAGNGIGNGGNIDIDVTNLNLTNESFLVNNNEGNGDAGNITINATGAVNIDKSYITNQVTSQSLNGNAGKITINTGNFLVQNGGFLISSTETAANAGDIEINATNNFELTTGGRLISGTGDLGNGGNIILNVGGDLNLDGNNPVRFIIDRFASFQDPILLGLTQRTGLFANTTQDSRGNGGNITLNVGGVLNLKNDADISISSEGQGNAGSNITINTEFLVASPNQNSDILATAEFGMGGNINITTQGIFGIEERPQNPFTNDIDASSEFGLDGTITINNPDVNALQTDTELPKNLVESEQSLTQACQSEGIAGQASGLVIKGKGGVPPEPTEPMYSDAILVNGQLTNLDPEVQSQNIKPIKTSIGDIYPARGVIVHEDGRVTLTAYPTDGIDSRTPQISPSCS